MRETIITSTGSNSLAFDLGCVYIHQHYGLFSEGPGLKKINAIRSNESHIAHLSSATEWISEGSKHQLWPQQEQKNWAAKTLSYIKPRAFDREEKDGHFDTRQKDVLLLFYTTLNLIFCIKIQALYTHFKK